LLTLDLFLPLKVKRIS